MQKIMYYFKRWFLLNKMVLIKSFLTGVLHDHFKLTYMYLNEEEKFRECCECYNSKKLTIQANLHVGFFTISFVKHSPYCLLNMFQLNDCIEI